MSEIHLMQADDQGQVRRMSAAARRESQSRGALLYETLVQLRVEHFDEEDDDGEKEILRHYGAMSGNIGGP